MSYSANQLSSGCLQVASFYCFTPLNEENISFLIERIGISAEESQTKGIVLIASEGVNGTICGSARGVDALLDHFDGPLDGKSLQVKISWSPTQAFRRFKVRRKAEIVTMGVLDVNPLESSGTYIAPSNWNEFLDDPDTIVIDTRNNYEISIGSFEKAINPHTDSFRQFPRWVDENLRDLVEKKRFKRIAMFCTGGIRCEKATAYLTKQGFSGVHHLHGGILRYLEEVPQTESRWEGECFVFDQRVALNHELLPGVHSLCRACGMPLAPHDLEKATYIPGVQCHHCKDQFTDEDRLRFADRQKHMEQSFRPLQTKLDGTRQ